MGSHMTMNIAPMLCCTYYNFALHTTNLERNCNAIFVADAPRWIQ